MFEKWSEFYITIGGSAVGLIGLLFVVVSLSAASEAATGKDDLTRGHSVYASPTVFHLGVVLVLSATALTPDLHSVLRGIAFFACGIYGLLYVGWVIRQFRSNNQPPGFEKADLWLYGLFSGTSLCGAFGCQRACSVCDYAMRLISWVSRRFAFCSWR